MRNGFSHLLWRRRLGWLALALALLAAGGVTLERQAARAGAALTAEGVRLAPDRCPDVLLCADLAAGYPRYLGRMWRWLVARGEVRPRWLLASTGALALGVAAAAVAYPKTRDVQLAARALRRRAEEDPWRVRRRRPLPLPGIYGRFWAARSQIRDMLPKHLNKRLAGRVLFLGLWGREPLVVYPGWGGKPELDHVLVVAPSGSGKGLLIRNNVAAYRGSSILADLKGDLYGDLAGYLTRRGHRCLLFGVGGVGHPYEPFGEFDDHLGLQAAATLLIQPDRDGRNQIFGERAALALHAGLLAARRLGRAPLPHLAEITARGMRSFLETLAALGDPEIDRKVNAFLSEPPGARDWGEVAQDRFLQSCWANLITRLEPLFSPAILAATSRSSFRAADLRRGPTTVFLHFPRETLEATLPLFQLVTESLLRGLARAGLARPEERARPVLWVCDEAHLLTPPRLPGHLNALRDWGVAAWLVLQSQAQLRTLYGDDGAAAVEAGCPTRVYYRPADEETPRRISERAGMMPFPQENTSQR